MALLITYVLIALGFLFFVFNSRGGATQRDSSPRGITGKTAKTSQAHFYVNSNPTSTNHLPPS